MLTPLQVIGRGAVAGYAGMAAMVAALPVAKVIRNEDSQRLPLWSNTPPAARVARRVIEGVAHRDVSRQNADQLNYVMHGLYAPALGAAYAVVEASGKRRPLRHGLLFGGSVWCLRLALLPGLDLGSPFWDRSLRWNLVDASLHLGFGVAVAYAYKFLEDRADETAPDPAP
ncbi:MAG TPA: hypothetical protein VFT62_00040 [Mycobacteriales bacterium]|nr:hypothetical protein [Mycobacteriales bacterium]